jgi:hypothetical protein
MVHLDTPLPNYVATLINVGLALLAAAIIVALLNVPLLLLHPTLAPYVLREPYIDALFLFESAALACGIHLALRQRSLVPVYVSAIIVCSTIAAGELLLPHLTQLAGPPELYLAPGRA